MTSTLVLVGLAAALGLGVAGLYNRLVRLRNRAENAWSDIDVQLRRRHDLVPNLVETVQGYATHERKTLGEVTEARGSAMAASNPASRARAEGELTRALRGLLAVAEAYPELRADQSFLELQAQLAGLEDAIQNARRYYNAVVRDLNTACEVFPSNLVAGAFGFQRRDYFELDEDALRSVPEVRFGASV